MKHIKMVVCGEVVRCNRRSQEKKKNRRKIAEREKQVETDDQRIAKPGCGLKRRQCQQYLQ